MTDGAMSLTVIEIAELLDPAELVAVIVYDVVELIEVGVPHMLPLVVPNDNPEGSEGEIDQEDISPPVFTGLICEIDVFFVKVNVEGE